MEYSSKFPQSTLGLELFGYCPAPVLASVLRAASTQLVSLEFGSDLRLLGKVDEVHEAFAGLGRLENFECDYMVPKTWEDDHILGWVSAVSKFGNLRRCELRCCERSNLDESYEALARVLAQIPSMEHIMLCANANPNFPDLRDFFANVQTSPNLKTIWLILHPGHAMTDPGSVGAFLRRNPRIEDFYANVGSYSVDTLLPVLASGESKLRNLGLRGIGNFGTADYHQMNLLLMSPHFLLEIWKFENWGERRNIEGWTDFARNVERLTRLNKEWKQKEKLSPRENISLAELVDELISINEQPQDSEDHHEKLTLSMLYFYLSTKPSLLSSDEGN